ncbi:MAG: ATP-binding protein [Candidatus Altiarchaeota archaeon]
MDKDYIVRLLYEYNPQIHGGGFEVPGFRRALYFDAEKWIGKKQAIAIVGLRRTGKTTILRQLMGNAPAESAFFSFDEEETQNKEVLVFVLDYILNNLKSKYVFLDEIHYVEDWEGVLKRYYDQNSVKFIISGSESLELSKANAALAGRLVTFRLDPLSFREYLGLKGRQINTGSRIDDWPSIEKTYNELLTGKEFFEREFLDYLYKGGFPELVNEDDASVIRKYTAELVVRKIIFRDIPSIFEVRRPDLLYEIFRYACGSSSSLFDVKNLSSTFSANQLTVGNYMHYLKSAFLIRVSEPYSRSPAKRASRNRKLHVSHPSIAFAVLGMSRDMLIEKVLGQYVESLFAGEYFWRDRRKNEVDLILDGKPPMPVEIKYKNTVRDGDLTGIQRFMEEKKAKKGIVVTKSLFERRKTQAGELLLIPAWLYSLLEKLSHESSPNM